jgi:hypothetical protein
MERQINNGDFEKLLRDNANQYRMYPSEKVWKGIHSSLHTRRRWYGLTAAIMLLVTGSIVSIIIYNDKPGKNNLTDPENISIQNSSQKQTPSTISNETKTFTPAINEVKPTDHRTANLTELYSDGPVFETPTGDNKQSNVVLSNNNLRKNSDGDAFESNPSNKNETLEESPFYTDLNLSKQKTFLNTEDAFIDDIATTEKTITDQSTVNENTEKEINDAISAIASQNILLVKPKKQSKVTAQVFFTPTVSYRKLKENKNVYAGSGFYVPTIDLNNIVDHKPAMGLEFGIEGKYLMNKKFSLTTGLQFNINRYDIRAYSHPTEIATVALTSSYGIVDSLATLSNYRNSGTSANWLENFYFQVAVPVGVEVILTENKNFKWGISGSIQPTYVIGDRAYVISSDYKNYAKFPDIMRRWNISTGVGTFVAYSTGRINWQVGPHLRYQHLSSFVSELSVKEKLYAIGLKVGATLNNKK